MKKNDKKYEAKMKALEELKSMMMSEDDMGIPESMQKITIASDSKEGLKEGLSKAEEIMNKRSSMMDDHGHDEEDMEEDEKSEDSYEDMMEEGEYDEEHEEEMKEYMKKMKK